MNEKQTSSTNTTTSLRQSVLEFMMNALSLNTVYPLLNNEQRCVCHFIFYNCADVQNNGSSEILFTDILA